MEVYQQLVDMVTKNFGHFIAKNQRWIRMVLKFVTNNTCHTWHQSSCKVSGIKWSIDDMTLWLYHCIIMHHMHTVWSEHILECDF